MRIERFDPSYHDVDKASELVYQTDKPLFDLFLRKPLNVIKKLITAGSNPYGYERLIVAADGSKVLGVMLYTKGHETNGFNNWGILHRTLGLTDFIRVLIMDYIDSTVLGPINDDDFYIASLAVDIKSRGMGVATKLLEHAVEIAANGGMKSIKLDVSPENKAGLNLYMKFGFRITGTEKIVLLRRAFHRMEFKLSD